MTDTPDAFCYSILPPHYIGGFATRREAIDAAVKEAVIYNRQTFLIGEKETPQAPESFWLAHDWLELVSCADEYCSDDDDWDESTSEQRFELEQEVQKVLAAWLDRHDLRPKWKVVRELARYKIRLNSKGQPFAVIDTSDPPNDLVI